MKPIIVEYLEHSEKSDQWRLVQDIEYDNVTLYRRVVVPAGYVTDFASSPQWLWWLIPSIGKYNRAALIHDFLYENRIIPVGKLLNNSTARKLADDTFLEVANQIDPARKWKHFGMYCMVRIFGGLYWKVDD